RPQGRVPGHAGQFFHCGDRRQDADRHRRARGRLFQPARSGRGHDHRDVPRQRAGGLLRQGVLGALAAQRDPLSRERNLPRARPAFSRARICNPNIEKRAATRRLEPPFEHAGTYAASHGSKWVLTMLRHTLNCLKAVPCAFLFYLAGCGGYGGGSGMSGYGGNPPMMMSMPTVMFSSPTQAPTIHLGQAVGLAWTSSNASSCSASSSSDIGGAFSGSEPVSGSVTVAPVGTGTVTYTLACTGAGGTGSATTVAVTVLPSILSMLSPNTITAIGSTVDPVERGGNPYGLAIAPATAGLVSAGDLIVCNFNDGATNTEGKGTTIVGLHPTPGSAPYRIAQSPSLQGCNALAILPDGNISAAAF